MAMTTCRECGKEISTLAASCPHCGAPTNIKEEPAKPGVATCHSCNIQLIPVEKKPLVSGAGLISTILVLVGILSMLFNWIIGLLIIIVALIIGTLRDKHIVMKCPQCGAEGQQLS